MTTETKQAVGSKYVLEQMLTARDRTWEVVDAVAGLIRPGMRESEAAAHCTTVMKELGMDRIWHPVIVRFGENTLKTFKQRSDGDPCLRENDIFFIDIGVVWNAHEGDAGATFVVGDDAQMQACADAARTLFDDVKRHWQTTRSAGTALYAFAERRAAELGWRLNLDEAVSKLARSPRLNQPVSARGGDGAICRRCKPQSGNVAAGMSRRLYR